MKCKLMERILLIGLWVIAAAGFGLFAEPLPGETAAPSSLSGGADSSASKEVEKPLEINGQSRNLSMMMVLKGDQDSVDFVDIRKNYQQEIPKTMY